jgi:hypothetical protein
MSEENNVEQTYEENLLILLEMAKKEIASGKVQYVTLEKGKAAELYKIRRWIIEHSPKWRSEGSGKIVQEMMRLGLGEDGCDMLHVSGVL